MVMYAKSGLVVLIGDEEFTTGGATSIINSINQRFSPYYENINFAVEDLNHRNIDFIIMACRIEDDEWKTITDIVAGFDNGTLIIDPKYKDVFSQVVNLS